MKKLTSLLLALGFFYSALADTFIVTSNADSGPGTLREAIGFANANGTAIADNITFNIPDNTEAGRTINLQSVLPALTSNIIIDGSTQPGTALGISNAKITLYLDHFTSVPFVFIYILNSSDISIYGLCFKFFDNPDVGGGQNYAIYLRGSNHVTVGAPGKGNLFSAVLEGITNNFWNYYNDATSNITIQGNVFGLNSNNVPVLRGSVYLINAQNILVGGDTPDEGNIFVGASVYATQAGGYSSPFFARVQNNKFDLDWNGSTYYQQGGSITLIGTVPDDSTITKTFVLDNVLSGEWPAGIQLSFLNHRAIIQGNKIGTDITGTTCQGAYYNNVGIYSCKRVIIGGYTAAEQNIIAGTIYPQSHGTDIIKNQFGNIDFGNNDTTYNPFVKIITYNNGLITGRANANAKIQLYTNICNQYCLSRSYLTTISADAAGNWSFPYTADMPNIVATGTTTDSSTSAFTQPIEDHLNFNYKQPTCGKSNGSITGIVITEGTHIKWYDSYTLKVLGTDTSLINIPAGSYVFTLSNGENGCPTSINFTLYDQSPPASIFPAITNTSCGQNNGYISVASYIDNLSYMWMNANYDSIGTGYFINKLAPGNYYLKASITSDTSCNKIYGPFEVQNLIGASLNTDNIQITASTCSKSNGSITGIAAINTTGTPFIQWLDSLNNPVGNNYDLSNIPPGKYRMKFKDASGCDTILTSFYTVTDNGPITIDISRKIITGSKCSGITGGIQQIQVSGGEAYQWINTTTNAVAGSAIDLLNVAPGNYQLQVTNQYGCSKTSAVITVPQSAFAPIGVTGVTSNDALCAQPDGMIKITSFSADSALYIFRWTDSTLGQTIGHGTTLSNLDAGVYQLLAKDSNGCEKEIFTAHIKSVPVPTINYAQVQLKNDNCNLHQGSITAVQVNGLTGPTVYTWYDQSDNIVGNNPALQNASTGTYTLKITDAGICNIQSTPFTIINTDNALPPPVYDDLIIPRYTDAPVSVKNPATGSYQLSLSASGSTVLQQNNTGNFIIPKITADTSVYIQRIAGECASPFVKVNIKVVDKSFFAVATAFTPNSDGRNDVLHVKVIGYIQLNYFRIFNRWGNIIFETHNINDGWDGRLNDVLQDAGGFMWTAQGKDINGNTLSSRGSFILIR